MYNTPQLTRGGSFNAHHGRGTRYCAHAPLAEDIGTGDVTSLATITPDTRLEGAFLVKAAGVVAGLEVVGEVFSQVSPEIPASRPWCPKAALWPSATWWRVWPDVGRAS